MKKTKYSNKKLLLTSPPVASLEPSTLKVRHFCGPTSLRIGSSFANSFAFDSRPYNSNNLHIRNKRKCHTTKHRHLNPIEGTEILRM